MLELCRVDTISVPGENTNIPCQLYFMIETFFITGAEYMAEGRLLFHSSMRQVRNLVDTEGYMIMKDRK